MIEYIEQILTNYSQKSHIKWLVILDNPLVSTQQGNKLRTGSNILKTSFFTRSPPVLSLVRVAMRT